MRLVLATTNEHKVEEIRALLAAAGISADVLDSISSLKNFPAIGEIAETADTFEGNARIKALACARLTGELSLADDSGLAVDALDGRPGIYSARYADTAQARIDRVLAEMREVAEHRRGARFVAAMALAWPDGRCIAHEGRCEGAISFEPHGGGGFGYDPIFWLPELGCSMAELSEGEKNAISHRGAALRAFLPELRAALAEL